MQLYNFELVHIINTEIMTEDIGDFILYAPYFPIVFQFAFTQK